MIYSSCAILLHFVLGRGRSGIYWAERAPLIDAATEAAGAAGGNRGAYGDFAGGEAVALRLLDDGATRVPQARGQVVAPFLVVALVDARGQTVAADSVTALSVAPAERFASGIVVTARRGVAVFSSLVLRASAVPVVNVTISGVVHDGA